MRFILRNLRAIPGLASVGFALAIAGCGGSGGMNVQVPISVSLTISKVAISQDGMPVVVQINIVSSSETALVSVIGLPEGVKETYAASDTNPSGTLTFTASASTPAGSTMPIINVNSAGQSASTSFMLIVTAASSAANATAPDSMVRRQI